MLASVFITLFTAPVRNPRLAVAPTNLNRIKSTPRMHRIAALMSIFAFSGLAYSAEKKCHQEELSNAEYAGCLEKASHLSDRELREAFEKALKKASAAASDEWRSKKRSEAEAAQRKWQDYRNAECSFEESQFEAGTGAGGAYLECVLRMNDDRMKYISSRYR
jgi:uncharacterized protein YecT (DUF1311 family)